MLLFLFFIILVGMNASIVVLTFFLCKLFVEIRCEVLFFAVFSLCLCSCFIGLRFKGCQEKNICGLVKKIEFVAFMRFCWTEIGPSFANKTNRNSCHCAATRSIEAAALWIPLKISYRYFFLRFRPSYELVHWMALESNSAFAFASAFFSFIISARCLVLKPTRTQRNRRALTSRFPLWP